MVPWPNLLAFAGAALIIIVIPGPSVLFTIGRALSLGRLGGVLSVVGNTLGHVPLVAAVALGVGVVIAQSVIAFTVIKLVGAAYLVYLVYLGVQAIRHRHRARGVVDVTAATPKSALRQIAEGFVVGITNPKTIAFFVAVLPQFVAPAAGNLPLQLFVLGMVFLVLGFLSDSVWALAAGTARDWFARSPRRISTMGATGGVLMIGLGGALAVTGSKS